MQNCDAAAFCNNTEGSFDCTCSPGYAGNGTSCTGKSSCPICLKTIYEVRDRSTLPYMKSFFLRIILLIACSRRLHSGEQVKSYAASAKRTTRGKKREETGADGNNAAITPFSLYSDINECKANVHNCDANAFCNNTEGSFNCTCSPGYTGNGTSCVSKHSRLI